MGVIRFLQEIYHLVPPADPRLWHRWNVFSAVKTIDGHWTGGYVWRRRNGDKWEYQRHEETLEEKLDRF